MKICFITLHWANNYGAALQAYAMNEVLKRYGDVSVIDYRSPKPAKGMQVIRVGATVRDVLRAGKDVFRLIPRYRVINKFRRFNEHHLNLTSRARNQYDLSTIADGYDAVIAGSDQIWSPEVVSDQGKLDDAYFLTFAKNKRRIAFASSMGSFRYDANLQAKIVSYLEDFHALAVREKGTAGFLSQLLGREVSHVVDPSLLLSRQEWEQRFPLTDKKEDAYILVYALKKDALLKRVVEAAAQEFGLRVVAIDQDPFINYHADQHLKDVGPNEFLELFQGASFVVTNSFHGTAFSLNLGKPFVVTTPPTGQNRIASLLGEVGETQRLVNETTTESQLTHVLSTTPDAAKVEVALAQLRSHSLAFLDKALRQERVIE